MFTTFNFKKRVFITLFILLAISLAAVTFVSSVETTKQKPYSLDTCLVSGEKLGTMGDPITYDHDGQEIKFCCKMCIKKFEADPTTYLAKLDQSPPSVESTSQANATCPYSDMSQKVTKTNDSGCGMKSQSLKDAPTGCCGTKSPSQKDAHAGCSDKNSGDVDQNSSTDKSSD